MPTKLSKRLIDNLEPRANEYVEWDTMVPGLGVRVRSSGRKTFVFRYRDQASRRQRKLSLGQVSIISLDEARLSARELGTQVAKGEDPAAKRAQNTRSKTTAAIAERFLKEHIKLKRKKTTYDQYELLLRRYLLPALGTIPMDELTKSDLTRMHSSHAQNAVSANRALAVFGSLHSYAIGIGAIDDQQSPAKGIERFKESSRERFLTRPELHRLGAALRKAETVGIDWQIKARADTQKHVPKSHNATLTDPSAVAALRLLILTGCRLREVLRLEWRHIDAHAGVMTLPDSKTGRKQVFLNQPAVALLDGLQRVSPFVFPGKNLKSPRHDLKRPWAAIRREAGLGDVRIHDLRHTYASYAAMSGLSLPVIGQLLGHADTRMTEKYAHFAAEPIKQAARQTGEQIARFLEPPEN